MLKKIIAGAGAVSIILCWPLATGQIGQRIYMSVIDNYHNAYLSVSNKSFERGYLSSNAVSRIELKGPLKAEFAEQGLPTEWLVKHHLNNGFLGVKSTSELVIDKKFAPLVKQVWGEDITPINLVTDSSLTGSTHFVLTINPMDYKNTKDDISVISKAFVLQGEFEPKGKSQLQYSLPLLKVATSLHENMVVNGIKGNAKGKMEGNFWIGTQNFTLDNATFTAADQQHALSLNGVNVEMKNELSQSSVQPSSTEIIQQVTNSNHIQVAKLMTLDGEQYHDFNFKLALKNLDYNAISQLAKMEQSPQAAQDPEQIQQAMTALNALIAHGAILDLSHLNVMTPDGMVNAQVLLNIQSGLKQASTNLTALTKQLSGNLHLVVPKALIEKEPLLANKLPLLIKQKIITQDQGNYQLDVKIVGDQIEFTSGLKLPLAMLALLLPKSI